MKKSNRISKRTLYCRAWMPAVLLLLAAWILAGTVRSRAVSLDPADAETVPERPVTEVVMPVSESELPDMPCIVLTTENGIHPYKERAKHPEGVNTLGETVINNDYVNGFFRMKDGERITETEVRIKVRGNTSAYDEDKDPYRLKLSEKIDLIGYGKERGNRDWVLLDTGHELTYFLGAGVSSFCGMEWTPAFKYVNLILNGDYRGIYVLVEAVEKGGDKIDITDEGFILEYSPYWWKNTKEYFRTRYCSEELAYVFEYPDIPEAPRGFEEEVLNYTERLEENLRQGNMFGYLSVDKDSFVKWILAKDILGMGDSAGSNRFLSLEKSVPEYPLLYRLKIGPLWDYDTVFMFSGFSQVHSDSSFYYPYLFGFGGFERAYAEKWKELRETYTHDLCHYIYRMKYSALASAMDESRALEHERWGHKYETVGEELDGYVAKLLEQKKLLDELILNKSSE